MKKEDEVSRLSLKKKDCRCQALVVSSVLSPITLVDYLLGN